MDKEKYNRDKHLMYSKDMIKIIAAIDSVRGLASDGEWDLPSVDAYINKKVSVSHFKLISDDFDPDVGLLTALDKNTKLWVLGSPELYRTFLPYADELYITQVCGIYGCAGEFPSFENDFVMTAKSKIMSENSIEYQHQIWKNKKSICIENENDV